MQSIPLPMLDVRNTHITGLRSPGQHTNNFEELSQTEQLKNLKLHTSMSLNGYKITRVPGGWIYDRTSGSVFVPYNNEFFNEPLQL